VLIVAAGRLAIGVDALQGGLAWDSRRRVRGLRADRGDRDGEEEEWKKKATHAGKEGDGWEQRGKALYREPCDSSLRSE
jgi:hypothetical protein